MRRAEIEGVGGEWRTRMFAMQVLDEGRFEVTYLPFDPYARDVFRSISKRAIVSAPASSTSGTTRAASGSGRTATSIGSSMSVGTCAGET